MAEEWQDIKKVDLGASKDEWQPLSNVDLTAKPPGRTVPQGFWGKAGLWALDTAKSTGEASLALGTGLVGGAAGLVAGGLTASAEAYKGNPNWGKAAQDVKETTADVLTYRPKSEGGKQAAYMGSRILGALPSLVSYPFEKAGQALDESGHPNLAYIARTPGEVLPYALPGAIAKAVPKVGAGVSTLVEKSTLPEKLYGSSIRLPLSKKWLKELPREEINARQRAIGAGLEGEITPYEIGAQKSKNISRGAKGEVESIVNDLTAHAKEGTPQAKNLLTDTDSFLDRGLSGAYEIAKKSNDIPGSIEALDRFKETFKQGRDQNLTPRQLQDTKLANQSLSNYLSENKALSDAITKGLAHEAMTTLETFRPELRNLNQKSAAYHDLSKAIEKRIGRDGNNNFFPLKTAVLIGSHPVVALIEKVLGIPYVKSKLAFALNKARRGTDFNSPQNPNLPPLSRYDPWADQRGWKTPLAGLIEDTAKAAAEKRRLRKLVE